MNRGFLSLLAAATLVLAGCAGNGAPVTQVPDGARLVAESPAPLVHTADAPGTVYVRDRRTGKIVRTARLSPGQRFEIPAPVAAGGAYGVYFKPAEPREPRP